MCLFLCKLLLYIPIESSIDSHSKSGAESISHGARTTKKSDEKAVVVCPCGYEAVKLTVKKEGLNKGRRFFKCPKPHDEQCGFFEWDGETPNFHIRTTARRDPYRSEGQSGEDNSSEELLKHTNSKNNKNAVC